MNNFTVLMQIEKQMQDQFHAVEEAEAVVINREQRMIALRLRMSSLLHTLAITVESSRPAATPECASGPTR